MINVPLAATKQMSISEGQRTEQRNIPLSRAALIAASSAFFFCWKAISSSSNSFFSFLGACTGRRDEKKPVVNQKMVTYIEGFGLASLPARHGCSTLGHVIRPVQTDEGGGFSGCEKEKETASPQDRTEALR